MQHPLASDRERAGRQVPSVNIDVRGQPTPHQPRRWSQSHGLGDHGRSERLGLARRQASAAWRPRMDGARAAPTPRSTPLPSSRGQRAGASSPHRGPAPRTCPTAAKLTAHQVVHRQWTSLVFRRWFAVRRHRGDREPRTLVVTTTAAAAGRAPDRREAPRVETRPWPARVRSIPRCFPGAGHGRTARGPRSAASVSTSAPTCRRCATRAPRRR